jgi:polyhydroxyalkanoate synthesis regulator phasin
VPSAAVPESQWESYVREFIEKYKLNDEQAQRARAILKDCQERAAQYTQKHKAEIEELDKKIAAASAAGGKSKELAELNERKSKLTEPVGQIFEQKLKPSLEKLPTRAQRQAADASRKPAGTSGSGKPGARPPVKPSPPPPPPSPEPPPEEPQEPPPDAP